MEPPRRQAAPAADALSSLPEHLLHDILARLNPRDAVRTSAICCSWRHRWESLPALSLSFFDGLSTQPAFVDGVLDRFAGRIPDFSIRITAESSSRVDDWLTDLSLPHRCVQSMDLRSHYELEIHSSIYSFNHLVVLRLHGCYIPSAPVGFAGFPALKELDLGDVQLPESEDLQAIIGRSPLLDALLLSDVYVPTDEGDCVIEAPNLRSLTITSVVRAYGWRLGELQGLDNATIELDSYVYDDDFGEFLARVAHARKLTLSTFYQPYYGDTLLETLPYTFVNLRSLFLWTHFCKMYAILATFCLLRNAPNLEELEIQSFDNQDQETEANAEFQNAQWTNGMCASLRTVKINDILCLSNEMCFIELVLSKAAALRTMSISVGDECSRSSENVLSELIAYGRASPHAQVIFKGKNELND
ncbi:unnamed protein product [Urochloa humidicola]